MASANEHKTTDLDSVEHSPGNSEKPTTPAVNSHALESQEPSVLEVCPSRPNKLYAMSYLTENTALHWSRSRGELRGYHHRIMGVFRCYVPICAT
jgi:hypothetical protein